MKVPSVTTNFEKYFNKISANNNNNNNNNNNLFK